MSLQLHALVSTPIVPHLQLAVGPAAPSDSVLAAVPPTLVVTVLTLSLTSPVFSCNHQSMTTRRRRPLSAFSASSHPQPSPEASSTMQKYFTFSTCYVMLLIQLRFLFAESTTFFYFLYFSSQLLVRMKLQHSLLIIPFAAGLRLYHAISV